MRNLLMNYYVLKVTHYKRIIIIDNTSHGEELSVEWWLASYFASQTLVLTPSCAYKISETRNNAN